MSEKFVTLAHGGGGRLQNELIDREIVPRFGGGGLPDAATLPGDFLFTTDSFVVTPRFFPGGDIGKLAVVGTVNDILVAGGTPRFLSLSLIIEAGFEFAELGKILDSARDAAAACGVTVVTGDTKVVPAGMADGIYLNTAGIGVRDPRFRLGRERFVAGDKILVNGTVGEHGMAILAARFGISGAGVGSDCGCLADAIQPLGETDVKFMRDPTRGGVGGVISEIVKSSRCGARLEEAALPQSAGARTVAKLLGVDIWFAACEGRVVVVAAADAAAEILRLWGGGAILGELNDDAETVTVAGEWGSERMLIVPAGDQLPRIC